MEKENQSQKAVPYFWFSNELSNHISVLEDKIKEWFMTQVDLQYKIDRPTFEFNRMKLVYSIVHPKWVSIHAWDCMRCKMRATSPQCWRCKDNILEE